MLAVIGVLKVAGSGQPRTMIEFGEVPVVMAMAPTCPAVVLNASEPVLWGFLTPALAELK
jgi:hypothetical protein